MSPLSRAIYEILRERARLSEPRITYAKLAEQLRDRDPEFEHVHHRNQELYAALTEVGLQCRRLDLPSLPALVVRADTKRPGDAYFGGHRRGALHWGELVQKWQSEIEAIKRAKYPKLTRAARPYQESPERLSGYGPGRGKRRNR